MNLTASLQPLIDAVTAASAFVPSRSPKPVLSCLRIVATASHLDITGTNLEADARVSVHACEISEPGETLVDAAKLRDILREQSADTVKLSLDGGVLTIRADGVYKLHTLNPADFPPLPEVADDARITIAGNVLAKAIRRSEPFTAKEGLRYAFNGVMLTGDAGKLILVATDGRRLAKVQTDANYAGTSAIVPGDFLAGIAKHVDVDDILRIDVSGNRIAVRLPDATFTSGLLEGQFPPYGEVIPKAPDRRMTAGTDDLLSAVRRAALLTSDDSKGVRMEFGKSGVVISSRNPEAGEAKVEFVCKYDGEPLAIGFNPAFLADALKVADADEVTLDLTAANRPGLLKAGEDFVYVVMPVNLS